MLEFKPEQGTLKLGTERMIIFRQRAMGALRGLMYEQLGAKLARALLCQFGYQCGQGDYLNLREIYGWETDMEALQSGAALHAWEGVVSSEHDHFDFDRETGRVHIDGRWINSYEAENHLKIIGRSDSPVCHSLTGYASGWLTALLGRPVLCIEHECMGMGHTHCQFEMRDAESWGTEADPWREALFSTQSSMVRTLEDKLRIIREQRRELQVLNERQRVAISELSTPILEIWDEILVLPLIGTIDSARGLAIMTKLLDAIVSGQARCVIIDITGVDMVDTHVSNTLLEVVQAASLLGTYCVITGINPSVAQTLVSLDAMLSGVVTLRDLKQGLRACLRFLAKQER
nr:XylR N-terminal domain-containing protein [Pseudenhygromyxa sp. WMMC2535]